MRNTKYFLICSLFVASILRSSPASAGVTSFEIEAVESDQFTEQMGVGVHIGWVGTAWDTAYSKWKEMLYESGIRYIRTSASSAVSAIRLNELYNQRRIRSIQLINNRDANHKLDLDAISGRIAYIANELGDDKVIAIEGGNEYSHILYTHDDTNWDSELRSHQKVLYQTVKSNPKTAKIPVLAPTIYRRLLPDYNTLGNLSAYADFGNLHYYTANNRPNIWINEGVQLPMAEAIKRAQITVPNNKIFITEMGYSTRTEAMPESMHQQAAAKYILREYAEVFRRRDRISKAFVYNLLDIKETASKKGFGLLNADLTAKPAFYAIRNINKILSDPGPKFEPSKLKYSIEGPMGNVRTLVMQKRNKRFYLVFYQSVNSYDTTEMKNIKVEDRSLLLDVSSHGFSMARTYLPTGLNYFGTDRKKGAQPVQTIYDPKVVSLSVPDELLIVELIP